MTTRERRSWCAPIAATASREGKHERRNYHHVGTSPWLRLALGDPEGSAVLRRRLRAFRDRGVARCVTERPPHFGCRRLTRSQTTYTIPGCERGGREATSVRATELRQP